MPTSSRPNPRQTAGFLAAVAYNPPPEEHGYWFPASSLRQARRSVSRSPFAPYLHITVPPTPEGDEAGVFLSTTPGPHPAPLPDPAVLPGYHRPLPDLLPAPTPLPAAPEPQRGRGRPRTALHETLSNIPDHEPTPLSPSNVYYWRKQGFDLYRKGDVIYKGTRPVQPDTADTPTATRPCHVYLHEHYRHRYLPQSLQTAIRYDIAMYDQHPYRYLALTAEQATNPDEATARFLRSFARRFTGAPTPSASLFADLYLCPPGASEISEISGESA